VRRQFTARYQAPEQGEGHRAAAGTGT